jgi:hypothetical protein
VQFNVGSPTNFRLFRRVIWKVLQLAGGIKTNRLEIFGKGQSGSMNAPLA